MNRPLRIAADNVPEFFPVRRFSHPLWSVLGWIALGLVACVMGYLIPSYGPYFVALLGGLMLFLVALRWPQELLLLTAAVFPVAGAVFIQIAGVVFRAHDVLLVPQIGAILVRIALQRQSFKLSKAALVLLTYSAFVMASAAWAERAGTAFKEGVQFFAFFLIFFVVDNTPWTYKRFERAVLAFLIGGALMTAGSLFGTLATPVLPLLRISGGLQLTFVPGYYHVVTIACVAGISAVLSLAFLLAGHRTQGQKLVLGFVVVMAVVLIAVINKRVPMIAFAAGLFVLFSVGGWRRGLLFSALGALAVVAIATFAPDVRQHFEDMTNVNAKSTKAHLYTYPQVGWHMFKAHPFIGGGGGAFEYQAGGIINEYDIKAHDTEKESFQAHNLVIKTVSDSGLIGLGLLSFFIGLCLRQAWRGSAPWGPDRLLRLREHLCRALLAAMVLEVLVSQGQNPHTFSFWWAVLALGNHTSQITPDARGSLREEGRARVATGPLTHLPRRRTAVPQVAAGLGFVAPGRPVSGAWRRPA